MITACKINYNNNKNDSPLASYAHCTENGGGNATIEIKHVNCSTSLDIEYTQLRNLSACELADNSDIVTSSRQTCKEKTLHTNINILKDVHL